MLQLLALPEMLSRVSDDLPSHAFSSLFPGRNKQVETLAKESFPDLEWSKDGILKMCSAVLRGSVCSI